MTTALFESSAFPKAPVRQESLAYVARCLSIGQCCALVGLSNTGKSTLLRSLQRAEVSRRCAQPGHQAPYVVFVDALDGAVPTEQSFYELLLRRMVQSADDHGVSPERVARINEAHRAVVEGAAPLACRSHFAQALHGEMHAPDMNDIVIVLDNFDDLLCELSAAPLRHLRALRDAYGSRLAFVIATSRPPDELRRDDDIYEFIELFQVYTHRLLPLTRPECEVMLDYVAATTGYSLGPRQRDFAITLGGGHPGLLDRVARALALQPEAVSTEAEAVCALLRESHVSAECSRMLQGLTRSELARLQSRGLDDDRASDRVLPHLPSSSLLSEVGTYVLVSPLLRAYIDSLRLHGESPAGVRCDLQTGQIWLHDHEITLELSEAQRRLLRHLYRNRGRVCGQQSIAEAIWDATDGVSPGAIYELVKRVRQKIEADWRNPSLLITIPGEGYRLELLD